MNRYANGSDKQRVADLSDYGIVIQYTRDDVEYATWYSDWMKSLALRHTLAELVEQLKGSNKRAEKASRTHLSAILATTSMQSQSQRRAQTGNVAHAEGDTSIALRGAIEIHFLFPEHAKAVQP